ncbi:hypothetical protein IW140_002522 [Coemansia sp. RSA 1813]|nr:hypothetical protein EV178_001907 [Coemansia sp. RSA 1646]KAJ1769626.1 hypothetical protein LPJ74_003875 [Coemansia sp. RSA 1843]KAJ2091001.1 hypothetical protein IW138_002195 [Coemansia sp. RSA 986]KAJ2215912.1 hypothetical protein EV179_001740 [Coemansia sp. RSA 487]KAJ2570246.1 hypothetical protein IW140_002522 [Coemansia sp. RSA 1813]
MIASKITSAIAFTAAVVSAQEAKPASPNERNVIPMNDHDKAYLTVTAPQIAQPAAVVAPQTVVQNAGSAEPTVTTTVTSGAASVVGNLGMSAAALVGTFFAASYF